MKNILILSFIFLTLMFVLLHPRINSYIPYVRQKNINTLIAQIEKDSRVDAFLLWQMRDFSPSGQYTFDREGIDIRTSQSVRRECGITVYKPEKAFSYYTSHDLDSVEFLRNEKKLSSLVKLNKKPKKVILQNNTNRVYYTDSRLCIVFLKDYKTLKQVNGFFDYKERDKATTENKNWLVVTAIKQ